MSQCKLYTPHTLSKSAMWDGTRNLHLTLDMAYTRLFVMCCSFLLVFLVIIGRLVDVSLLRGGGESTFVRDGAFLAPKFRASIVDRSGELLVTSLKTSSLYANPRVVLNPQEVASKLSEVLPELKPEDILERLHSKKGFVWLARHLPPQKQAAVIRLGLPGLYFQKDERRVYPHGELFSHIIGYTDIDNQGLGGIERSCNELLLKQEAPLALSLDIRVQHVLRDELLAGIEKYSAQGGAGLVMDVRTGEILAMVSLPDFDPNQVGKMGSRQEALFNRVSLGVYEMGSSFKIFNTALYLENNKQGLSDIFDVSHPLKVGRFRIKDFHAAHYPLSVAQIFTLSSNIGAAKMAMQMGGGPQMAFFAKLGFFQPASLEIPELGSPLYPRQWTEATTITTSYGYGVAITPLQLASAIAGIVNKGMMVQPTLFKVNPSQKQPGKRIVSEKTSEMMCHLLYAVAKEGTARKARVEGYQVGGKTGTANTLAGKSYKEGENMTSLVTVFPMSQPQYLVLVMIDRPQAIKETYGFNAAGWNAAPVGGKVIERIAPLLHVAPRSEDEMVPQATPTLVEASVMH